MNDVPAPPESVTTRAADRWRSYWSLAAIVVIAFLWLYRSPWLASDLPVAPDSVEYALAPAHLLETGRYAIVIEGREIPPRYPPWFSSAVILPVYAVLGTDPGNAILPVTALAVAGIALAWLIGRRISSHAGAVLASIAVLALPTYANWSKHVMSDVPCVTLMLGAWLLYLRLRASSGAQVRGFFVAGVLVAMGALFRPVFAAMVLPFLWAALGPWRAMFLRLGALGVPLVVGATASLAYNVATFGSVSRNGYNLWVPVPNDYPHLLFSLAHVPLNLRVITATSLPLLAAVVAVLAVVLWFVRRPAAADERRALGESIIFLALTTTPIVIFHLVYFFPSDRFFLPLMAGMAIIAGALAGRLLGAERERVLQALVPALLALVIFSFATTEEPLPHQRLAAERINANTPEDAIVISGINPVYLERLAAHGSARRIVPLSRRVEYASKLLAWKKIENPQPAPRNWGDHRCEGLRRGGAVEAVNFVASEQIDALHAAAKAGTAVYLDPLVLDQHDGAILEELQARFGIQQRAPFLYQLEPL